MQKKTHKHNDQNRKSVRENLIKIISHDIYSPLRFSAMIGKAVVLQQNEMNKEEVLSTLEDINITNAKILVLLSNILKVVEFDNEDYLPFFFEEHLHTLIQEKVDFFRLLAKNKNVELVNEVPPSIYLKTDKTLLCIVIQNLINNAIKFTPAKGIVQLSARVDKEFTTIFISDTGKGMSAQMVTAIEKNKSIMIQPDTEDTKGNGLGWSLIKELMLILKGKYKVASKVNKGTVISLQFPSMG